MPDDNLRGMQQFVQHLTADLRYYRGGRTSTVVLLVCMDLLYRRKRSGLWAVGARVDLEAWTARGSPASCFIAPTSTRVAAAALDHLRHVLLTRAP